jgi:hypothetical protein
LLRNFILIKIIGMKNFNLFLFALLIGGFAVMACGDKKEDAPEAKEETVSNEPSGKITISKTEYEPGEEISLAYTAEGDFQNNSWIGIIPSDIKHGDESENDKHDVSYRYFKDKNGKLTFTAPDKPGNYDFRMHTTDNNGKEVTYVSFSVTESDDADEESDDKSTSSGKSISLSSNKSSYKPGESITIKFTAPSDWGKNAWIGIIPSDVKHGDETENDKHDLSYRYLSGKTSGTLTLNAPTKSGKYDLRMHDTDNNGKEVKYISFTVK